MKRFLRRWFALFSGRRVEDDLAREMDAHLALLEDEHRRRGLSADEARLAARRAMGSVALATDLHRDARSFVWLEDLVRDSRHALRSLRRAPRLSAVIALTLALGIGATTAIFSVVNAVLVRPLPYPDSDRLVFLFEESTSPDQSGRRTRRPAMDVQTVAAFRTSIRTLSGVSVHERRTATVALRDQTVRLNGSRVSAAFLALLGAQPVIGRLFEAQDESTGSDAVVLLSHGAWLQHFGGSPGVVGTPMAIDGREYSVIGVLPQGFYFFPQANADFWTPFVLPASGFLAVPVVAKLNAGVSPEAALADMTTVLRGLRGESDSRFSIVRVRDEMVAPVKPALLVLSASVGFVLIICCVNVANLLLARITTRAREIALRASIGATAWRIVRMFLAEGLLLSAVGAAAGIALAIAGIRVLRVLAVTLPRPEASAAVSVPRINEVGIDVPMLLFALAVSLATGLLIGVVPALRRGVFQSADALRGTMRSGVHVVRSHRVQSAFVVLETALALVLLVGGALMMTSFVKLATIDPGYEPNGVVTFQATVPDGRDMGPFADELVAALRSIADVQAAGYSIDGLMMQGRGHFPLRRTADRRPPTAGEAAADPVYISGDYLEAMGIQVVAGRGLETTDRLGSQQVMLVNRSLVRSGMVGADPLGTRVFALFRNPWEIVGVVEDTRPQALDSEPFPQFYIDVRQLPGFPFSEFRPYFAVRTNGDVAALLANLRGIVRRVDPRASVDNVATVDQLLWDSLSRPRFYTVLIALFAGVAALLAVIGISGVMAYVVEQRTAEIGIRMALGGRRAQVLTSVLGRSVAMVCTGMALGLAGAAGLTRFLEGLLFGVTPLDPATFAGVAVLFTTVSVLAAAVPARRATRVDPLVALRSE